MSGASDIRRLTLSPTLRSGLPGGLERERCQKWRFRVSPDTLSRMTVRIPRRGLVPRGVALAVAAVIGAFMWSSVADAQTLSKDRARQASLKGIQKHCRDDPYCTNYGVSGCRRPGGRPHRMRCNVFVEGKDKKGYWHCSWTDEWSLKPGRGLWWSPEEKLWWSQTVYNRTFRCIR